MVGVCGDRADLPQVCGGGQHAADVFLAVSAELLALLEGARESPLSESTKRELLVSESAWWID